MKLILLLTFLASSQACWTSTVSLKSKIKLALDEAQNSPTQADPARNILKTTDRNCIDEKISKDADVKPSQAAFILTMVSFLCAPIEHHEKTFDYYLKVKVPSGLSIDCVERKLMTLSSDFEIIQSFNPSKSEKQCQLELSDGDRKIVKNANAMREQTNFDSCDEEFYVFVVIEDYLFKYLQDKPANDEEISQTKKDFVKFYHEMTQRTIDCILNKL